MRGGVVLTVGGDHPVPSRPPATINHDPDLRHYFIITKSLITNYLLFSIIYLFSIPPSEILPPGHVDAFPRPAQRARCCCHLLLLLLADLQCHPPSRHGTHSVCLTSPPPTRAARTSDRDPARITQRARLRRPRLSPHSSLPHLPEPSSSGPASPNPSVSSSRTPEKAR